MGEGSVPLSQIRNADVLVLPIIVTNDGVHLNAPFSESDITLLSLTQCLKENAIVVGGHITPEIAGIFKQGGFRTFDYFTREELIVKNCIPTAEGALQIAMEELAVTIRGLNVLVLGYGRVGRTTARLFSSVGANVSGAARKFSDLAWCRADGIEPIHTNDALNDLSRYDLIINTVPSKILDRSRLMTVSKDALLIDLASKPGGVDFDAAGELGLKVIWALSLPLNAKKQNRSYATVLLLLSDNHFL